MKRAQLGPALFLSIMDDELEGLISTIRGRVEALGYELVDLRKRGSQKRPLLQVRIDVPDAATGRGITHDDCAVISRGLEQWLDETGVLGERYVLEVSSPGIERPIRWAEHWSRSTRRSSRRHLGGQLELDQNTRSLNGDTCRRASGAS